MPSAQNISDYQIKALQEWLFVIKELDSLTEKILNGAFNLIKKSIADKAVAAIDQDDRLTRYDENIYVYYKRLMNCYTRTAEMYIDNRDNIKNENIKKILEGIYSVIVSRLKLYDEHYGGGDLDTNPVFLEKRQILHANIKLYSKNFEALKDKFKEKYINECLILSRQNLYENMDFKSVVYVAKQILKIIEDCLAQNFYRIYEVCVKASLNNLNDMQARKVTSYYHDLLKEEQEILSSIMIIQIRALECEIEKSETDLEEKTLLFNILTNLREGYQYLGKEINEIMECFKEAGGKAFQMQTEPVEDLLEDLDGAAANIITVAQFDEQKESYAKKLHLFNETFITMIKAFLDKELNTFDLNKSIYEMKKLLSQHLLMSEEMIGVYERIANDFIKSGEYYGQSVHIEIINGINETVEIKIESINESKQSFINETDEILSGFDKNKIIFSEDDKAEVVQNAFEIWNEEMINCPPEDDRAMSVVEKIFNDILKCESVFAFKELLNKKRQNALDAINKKTFGFKRDTLLFEVSTYEEIMAYSVTRLTDDEYLAGYVALMNDCAEALERILKKNNIEMIRPQPHDIFNGKEHEVLLAEKNPDFDKGEIIKLMNCGYKQDNTVIVRANVIAAK